MLCGRKNSHDVVPSKLKQPNRSKIFLWTKLYSGKINGLHLVYESPLSLFVDNDTIKINIDEIFTDLCKDFYNVAVDEGSTFFLYETNTDTCVLVRHTFQIFLDFL